MSFYHRYELVKLVNNGDPKSFEAREIQTGRQVLLHLWSMGGDSSSSPLLTRLRALLAQDPAHAAGRLLEVQESAQPPYAVTALEPGFVSIEGWLASFAAGAQAQTFGITPVEPPPAMPRSAFAAGPTVDMPITAPVAFPPSLAVPPQPSVPVPPQAPPASPPPMTAPEPPQFRPPAPVPPPVQEAGEFTRMFQGSIAQPSVRPPAAQPPASAPPPYAPAPAPTAPVAAEPGEFTRLFASPLQAAPATPAPSPAFGSTPPAPGAGMGEFTRLFASPSAAPAPPLSSVQPAAPAQAFSPVPSPEFAPAPPPMATPPHPLFPEPGPQQSGFEPLKQPAPPLYAPPPVPAAPPPGSGFTDMFGGPVQQPSTPAYGAPTHPPAQSGPSDFERFFANPLGASPMPLEEIERGRMAAPAPPPSSKPFRGPGDFTLQFGRDAAKQPPSASPELSYSPPPAPTPQARMSSGATGLFSAPTPDYGAGFSSPAAPSGPGEFTRIIQGPPKQGDSSAPPPAQFSTPPSAVAAPVPQGKSKLMPILMGVLAVVVVALVITVIILVLKK
ncbi:MAG TPA: hypothetical protein PKJ41_14140 [Bryobacteraceae bacterium]|nr:hypothetical protein [Bryobacteraceae bacterium]HPT25034.1 hypothetical protein [Bryobacteraceae bacterium]